MDLASIAVFALISAFVVHVGTAFITVLRLSTVRPRTGSGGDAPHVSIIVPVAHLEEATAETLRSAFSISYPAFELIFCVPLDECPATALVQDLMRTHPNVSARLLTGRENMSFNPKIDNLEKGWNVTKGRDWIIIADSNLMMPPDFVDRLFSSWREDTALTCSPPVGTDPKTFWGDVECAFLNTYQGRLQLASDTLGLGYAHGKAMLFKRELLDADRGLDTLKFEIAEDSAATKLVRSMGKRVRLVDRPFLQPVGRRTWSDVWHRHLRWAQLRRSSFPIVFALEPLTTSFVPGIAAAGIAHSFGFAVPITLAAALLSLGCWIATEVWLARRAGWPLRSGFVAACLCRDCMIVLMWLTAWFRRGYRWRGNPVTISDVIKP